MKDLKNLGLQSSKLVQEQERFNKRMNLITGTLGCLLMSVCVVWWFYGVLS